MKFRSLKRSFRRILVSLIAVSVAIGLIALTLGNELFSGINRSLTAQSMVSDYFDSLSQMQDRIKEHLTVSSEQSAAVCREEGQVLKDLSARIAEELDAPSFTDLYHQTKNYLAAATAFLDSGSGGDTAALYQKAQHIGELIANRYSELTAAKEQILLEKTQHFQKVWQLILLTIIVLMMWLSAILAMIGLRFIKRTITPIVDLTEKTEELAAGKLDIERAQELLPRENNETKVLAVAFYEMAATIRDQMEQLKEKIEMDAQLHRLELENMQMQVALAKTENMFTQSLVNPHFLFNCLNTLAGIAYTEDAPETRKSAILIARFLRESLSRIGKDITVRQELDHLQQYIDIQKLRFEERITFQITCEAQCEQAVMPAMLVQPLVENAVMHGIGTYIENARIEVGVRLLQEKTVEITVMDNGIGMEQEKVQQLLKDSQKDFSKRERSFGLRSILTRLRASMGDQAKFSIESRPGETAVTLTIPFRTS